MVTQPDVLTSVARHRRNQRARGVQRIEVQVRSEDVALLRAVAAALADPLRAPAARAVLLSHIGPSPEHDLKAYLEAAPLEGVALERSRDFGRAVDL